MEFRNEIEELNAAVLVSSIAGPELDRLIDEYDDGTRELSKANVLRDLRAATNLARALALSADALLEKLV